MSNNKEGGFEMSNNKECKERKCNYECKERFNGPQDYMWLDKKKRAFIRKTESGGIEIRTFHKDGMTLKARFLMAKDGERFAYKIGYNKAGVMLHKTTYLDGIPHEVTVYDDVGRISREFTYDDKNIKSCREFPYKQLSKGCSFADHVNKQK